MGFFLNNPNIGSSDEVQQEVIYKIDTFIATTNQRLFNLNGTYVLGKNRVEVFVGQVPQFGNFAETSSKSITLDSGVEAGTNVTIRYS